MSILWRRLAERPRLDRLSFVDPRDVATSTSTSILTTSSAPSVSAPTAAATVAANTTLISNDTASPYDHGLNGVNQFNNALFTDVLWWSIGIVGLIILLIRIAEISWAKIRQVSAMSVDGERQGYWKQAQWHWMPTLKKNIIFAPLFRKRHNREIRLSAAMNMGTLPSRLHFVLLASYAISNIVYMLYLDWRTENRYSLCAELRGRSGTLAAVNMVPLIIFAGRNNPLISMLKISFDTYNLFHRWIGRILVVEVLVHCLAWFIVQMAATGFSGVWDRILYDPFIASGTAGTWAFLIILILSLSPIRHAFYETFLNTHIILAVIGLVSTLVHCMTPSELPGGLPQLPWVWAVFSIWIFERVARMIRLTYFNYSVKRGFTEAIVEPMPGEACRVTMHLPRYVAVNPGSHAYIRFAGINPWENHPFSIAWTEHHATESELPTDEKDSLSSSATAVSSPFLDPRKSTTSVSFVIAAQTGFTRQLYNRASTSGSPSIRMRAAFEGPYAGHHSLDSYGHAVLIAGATGITHAISYLRPLIQGYKDGTVATRKITLIWIIRDYESLEWVRPWMDTILSLPNRRKILTVKLFVTRPKNKKEVTSASATVQMFPGRPNIPLLLKKEVEGQVGAMCVHVCGPGGLADDVRSGVREVQEMGSVVDFVEESFTW